MECEKKNLDNQYILRDISPILLSDETLTPNNLPRNTQPSLGKYLVRVDGANDSNNRSEICPKILDNWAARSRAFWVDKPGRNDLFQTICKSFSGDVHNYSPKNNVQKMLFPRPASCELEYINEKRLCNVRIIEEMYKEHSTFDTTKTTKDLIENPCEFSPPFWWKTNDILCDKFDSYKPEIQDQNKQISKRWRPIPDPIGQRNKTKCERKEELILVGQPFKHEACMFYNQNYPAPKLKFLPQKFSI